MKKTVEALRQLRLEGTLTTTSTLSNSHRILSMKQQFKESEGNVVSERFIEEFRKNSLQGACWVGDDAILAPTKQIGLARAKRVKEVLGQAADKVIFYK